MDLSVTAEKGSEDTKVTGTRLEYLSGFWGNARIASSEESLEKGFSHIETGKHMAGVIANGNAGAWGVVVSGAGTPYFGPTNRHGGGLLVRTGTGDNDEVTAMLGGAATTNTGAMFRISDLASEKTKLVFEVAILPDTIAATENGFFVGLVGNFSLAADGIIEDTGGLDTARDLIGFFKREGDAGLLDFVYQANGQTIQIKLNGWTTLSTTVIKKVGFVYDPAKPDTHQIVVYEDAVPFADTTFTAVTAANIALATFPDADLMTLAVCSKNAEGAAHDLILPFIGCYQDRVA